ncbi:MotA/TolQ/ExbB proton channel family protein [Roseimicrobium sp. ORNL1]|uniref:MotA/TolQ/ExbB proton channel family protein n=1 Tax=Roseimicrobium sp. ORNL1 TaxID=2711231 RepID=UPI0013E1183D|nr:MotA/TolQ/ExbB proton channel family protein [Roseimicrobium sp. ORNL1]QIF01223.1 MotA/TolQ/ExbB proton channel family protein [Roseimicrobium sp. ORNL1]
MHLRRGRGTTGQRQRRGREHAKDQSSEVHRPPSQERHAIASGRRRQTRTCTSRTLEKTVQGDASPTYHPAMSEAPNTSSAHATGRKLAKTGAWMHLAILIGMIGTVIGMTKAFETLGTAGVEDPSHLSAAIGQVLWSTAIGMGVGTIGALLICIAVIATPYRDKWVFWFMIASGVAWSAAVYLLPLGLLLLAIALIKRHEFFPPKLSHPASPA